MLPLSGGVGEAGGERAVFAADGQGLLVGGEPGLGGGVGEEFGGGAGGDEVVAGEAGAVVEEEVVGVEVGLLGEEGADCLRLRRRWSDRRSPCGGGGVRRGGSG